MEGSLVQLQQEDNQDEKSIEHDEEEDGFVAKLNQIISNASLQKEFD